MITELYERRLKKKGAYRAGRNCMYLWFALIGVAIGIALPLIHYLTEENYTLTAKGVIFVVAMLLASLFSLIEHFKMPKSSLVIDGEGILFNSDRKIKWSEVKNVSVTDTQLSAPYKKNFNFIGMKNKFMNVQFKDGTFKEMCLDSLSFNPLVLLVAVNVFSRQSYCNPKAEERSFAKLLCLFIVALFAIIIYCVYFV